MAWTDYYMQSTANDLNPGSTTADAASVTDVGGQYKRGTGAGGNDQYVSLGGTPFSGLTANVSRVSIYTAGATTLTFTALATAINAGGLSIDISITDFIGTRPADLSTKTCKVDGAWATSKAINSLGAVTVPNSARINIKSVNGGYASQATQTWALGGAAGKIVWYRGYKTTIGDLDTCRPQDIANWAVNSTDCPSMTFSANNLLLNATDVLVTGIILQSSSTSNSTVRHNGARGTIRRCGILATGANAASQAVSIAGTGSCVELCFLKATSSAAVISASVAAEVRGNYIKGGLNGVTFGAGSIGIYFNSFDSIGGDAIVQTGNNIAAVYFNTIYNPTGHGINLYSSLASAFSVVSNAFHTGVAGKYPLFFSGSTDVGGVDIANNSVYNWSLSSPDANGFSNGLGDIPAFDTVTETTDPLPNAASHKFNYAGTTGQGYGFPAFFFDTDDSTTFLSNRCPGATDSPLGVILPSVRRTYPAVRNVRKSPNIFISGGTTTTQVVLVQSGPRRVIPARSIRKTQNVFLPRTNTQILLQNPRRVIISRSIRKVQNVLVRGAVHGPILQSGSRRVPVVRSIRRIQNVFLPAVQATILLQSGSRRMNVQRVIRKTQNVFLPPSAPVILYETRRKVQTRIVQKRRSSDFISTSNPTILFDIRRKVQTRTIQRRRSVDYIPATPSMLVLGSHNRRPTVNRTIRRISNVMISTVANTVQPPIFVTERKVR